MANELDKLASALLGVAFASKVFDDRKKAWARAAYGAVGADLIANALGPRTASAVPQLAQAPREVQGKVVARSMLSATTGQPTVPLKFEARTVQSIGARVALIHKQALSGVKDPKVYALARSVLNRKCGDKWCIPERDAKGELSALFTEVRKRVRYTLDPVTFDAFQSPGKTLELKTGDCDCQVALLGAMCMSIGYPAQTRVVHTKGWETWNHIYLRAKLPTGGWWPLDPTMDVDPGWEVPESQWVKQAKDFEIKDE